MRQPGDLGLFQQPRQPFPKTVHMPFDASLGFQTSDVLFNVLGDRDSFGVKATGFPGIESASLDSLDLAFQVALDRLGNALVRASLDFALASALIADPDVPRPCPFSVSLPSDSLLVRELSFTHISLLTEVLTVINLAVIFHNTVHLFELSNEPNENTIIV